MAVEIIKVTGEKVWVECEYFADENVPQDWRSEHCHKCLVKNECWFIYTRRV